MIWIDDQEIRGLGIRPSRLSGFLGGARAERALVGLPGTTRQLVGGPQAPAVRVGVIAGRVPLSGFTDRPAAIAAIERACSGERWVRTMDRPGVRTRCRIALAWEEIPQARGLTIPTILVTLTCTMIDGGSESWPAPAPILLGTTAVAVTPGSMPSTGWLLAWGYTSPLVITYRTARGVATTSTITQALDTGEHVAIDLETLDVWRALAAGARERVPIVTGTLPVIDPADCVGSRSPTLALSSGTGLLLPIHHYRL